MWGRVVPSNFYPSHCGLPRLCSLEVGSRSLLPTESMSIILRGWDFIPNDWDRRILIKLFSSKCLWFFLFDQISPKHSPNKWFQGSKRQSTKVSCQYESVVQKSISSNRMMCYLIMILPHKRSCSISIQTVDFWWTSMSESHSVIIKGRILVFFHFWSHSNDFTF